MVNYLLKVDDHTTPLFQLKTCQTPNIASRDKCPVPRVPPSDQAAGDPFPPIKNGSPSPPGTNLLFPAGIYSPADTSGSSRPVSRPTLGKCPVPRSGSVPSHAREASRPNARWPTLRASCHIRGAPRFLPDLRVRSKARRTANVRVYTPKLHFTRVSSNPIARFGHGVETKSEFSDAPGSAPRFVEESTKTESGPADRRAGRTRCGVRSSENSRCVSCTALALPTNCIASANR